MPNKLSSARRSELRAEAHTLSPVVIIGDKKGLTDEVIAEVDRSLKAHELIKIRAATEDRDARNVWMESICEKLGAHPVQQIGKVLVIYRENPKETAVRKPRAVKPAAAEPAKRSERPRSRTPSPRPESEPRRRRPRTSR
jgi:putative YhbY family RNA-binding protein